MKINARTFIIIGFLLASVALYLFTDAGYAAFLVVLFAVILGGAALIAGLTGDMITAKIATPLQGDRGQEAKATLRVSNPGRLPIIKCRLNIAAENMLNGEKDEIRPDFSIWPGRTDSMDFALKDSHCGLLKMEVEGAEVTDPLNIFARKTSFDKSSELISSLYYLPQVSELIITPEDVSTYDMESYKYSQSQKGSDPSEMFDIKAYGEGDNYKAIHWKLSSKLDEIMIREHGLPIENRVLVIMDKRPAAGDKDYIDRKVEFTASFSYTLLRRGIYHSLGWFDYVNDRFETVRVDSEEAFWMAVTALISSPFRDDEKSAAQQFAESDADKDFSNYVYISETTDGIEILMNYGQTDIYGPEDFR